MIIPSHLFSQGIKYKILEAIDRVEKDTHNAAWYREKQLKLIKEKIRFSKNLSEKNCESIQQTFSVIGISGWGRVFVEELTDIKTRDIFRRLGNPYVSADCGIGER